MRGRGKEKKQILERGGGPLAKMGLCSSTSCSVEELSSAEKGERAKWEKGGRQDWREREKSIPGKGLLLVRLEKPVLF